MKEARSFRVEAVVLRHADWGEADRLLTLYTRERGKVRAIAKGARKIRSRKAGHLEPFTRVTLQLAKGRDLLIVTQADTLDAYLPLGADLVKTGYASYAVELLDRFTYEDESENYAIFRLLTEVLGRIASRSGPLAGHPLLRGAPAGSAGLPPAPVRVRQLRREDPGGRPVLFPGGGRRAVPEMRRGAAGRLERVGARRSSISATSSAAAMPKPQRAHRPSLASPERTRDIDPEISDLPAGTRP